jgi:hypothetical protein
MKKVLLVWLFAMGFSAVVSAQCPMCKTSTQNSVYAKNINAGILYLLAFPFVIAGGVGIYWYKNREKFHVSDSDNNPLLTDIHPN